MTASGFPSVFGPDVGYKPSTGGGFSVEPLTAILGIGSIASSIFGGSQAASAQRDSAAAQLKAAKIAADAQKEAAILNMTRDLTGMQFNEGVVAPGELARQKDAFGFKLGPMAALARANSSDEWARTMDRLNSGPSKEAARFQNIEGLKQSLGERTAAMQGMFGRIAPIRVDDMFA